MARPGDTFLAALRSALPLAYSVKVLETGRMEVFKGETPRIRIGLDEGGHFFDALVPISGRPRRQVFPGLSPREAAEAMARYLMKHELAMEAMLARLGKKRQVAAHAFEETIELLKSLPVSDDLGFAWEKTPPASRDATEVIVSVKGLRLILGRREGAWTIRPAEGRGFHGLSGERLLAILSALAPEGRAS